MLHCLKCYKKILKSLCLVAFILSSALPLAATSYAEFDDRLAAWVRLGDIEKGMTILKANQSCISRVLVSDHCIAKDGIHLDYRVSNGKPAAEKIVAWCHAEKIPVLMGLGNYGGGFSNPGIIVNMLRSPMKRKKHIEQVLSEVKAFGYDGVDLDYENLPPTARQSFTVFVKELGHALHQQKKLLDVTVPPKFSSPGWKQTKAYDWYVLPKHVDRFNVMCYDWFIRSGPPGPIIPLGVTKKVVKFIKTCPHPERFWIGHPTYGNHWIKKTNKKWRGKYDGATTWQKLAKKKNVKIKYKSSSVGGFEVGPFAHFSYKDKLGQHSVWFGDHKSLAQTMDVVEEAQLGGIFIWRVGFEDQAIWPLIRKRMKENSEVSSSPTDDASLQGSLP